MPRVHKQTKIARGVRFCGAAGCNHEIQPGESYYWWKFRTGGRQIRCAQHPPKPWELTQSKMSTILQVIEEAQTNFGNLDETKQAVEDVANAVEEVIQEYRDAAESFGGGGPNGEKADELEDFLSELQSFEPDTPEEEEFDEAKVGADLSQELFGIDMPNELTPEQDAEWRVALQMKRDEWEEEHEEANEEVLEAAREQAGDLLNQCPA